MDIIAVLFNLLLEFDAYMMLAIFMLPIALLAGLRLKVALKACLTLGIGFIGIFIVFDHFIEQMSPVLTKIVIETGTKMTVFDVGWPPMAKITWSFQYVPIFMLMIVLTNFLMFICKKTETINIDIWNYWHFIFVGQMVFYQTNSVLLSMGACLFITMITLKLADLSADHIRKFTGIENISITTLPCVCYYPIGLVGSDLFDCMFNKNKSRSKEPSALLKLTFLKEPMFIGCLMGIGLGMVARYSFVDIMRLSFNVAAVVYILPIVTGILTEGLMPISAAVKGKLMSKYPSLSRAKIGLHFAIILGDPAVIITGILLMPIVLALAFILPGNRFIPLGSLPNMIGAVPIVVVACNRDILKSTIVGSLIMCGHFYVASRLSELYTALALNVGDAAIRYDGLITSFIDGGNLLRFWVFELFSIKFLAFALLPLALFLFRYTKKRVSS